MEPVWSVSKLSTESVGSRRQLYSCEYCVHTADAVVTKQFRELWSNRSFRNRIYSNRKLECTVASPTVVARIRRWTVACGCVIVSAMELCGERYRPGIGTALQIAFAVGFMMQPGIAYFLRDEFWYQVTAQAPNFLFPALVM